MIAGPVAGGEAGAAGQRQLRGGEPGRPASWPSAAQLGLDLAHQPVQHPGAAVEAAAGLLGVRGRSGLRGRRW